MSPSYTIRPSGGATPDWVESTVNVPSGLTIENFHPVGSRGFLSLAAWNWYWTTWTSPSSSSVTTARPSVAKLESNHLVPASPSISDAAVCPAADAHASHVARRMASGAPPTPKRSMPESWTPSAPEPPFTSSKTKRYVEPIGILGGDGGDSGVPTGTLGGGGGGGDGSGGGGKTAATAGGST